MTLAEMGFTNPATWAQILERVRELGDVCPPEVGPLMRLADTEQKKGEWYGVAMEPISVSGGYPIVFYVGRDGGGERWLDGDWVDPDYEWTLGGGLLFRLRKSSALEPKPLHSEPLDLDLELAIKTVKDAGYQVSKIL